MAVSSAAASVPLKQKPSGILMKSCFALFVVNLVFFPTAYHAGWWIFDSLGRGIPTDFVNVWSAGRLVLEGHPALAYDWGIQKQIQVAVLGQSYDGNFAWHYPPPFLFVAATLAHFPYAVAFIGWAGASLVPYLVTIRALVARPFGWIAGFAFPVVLTNILVGQNGFFTASLIGGFVLFLPKRPVLAGICLGLLSYKPQYGLLFPLVLIAAAQWRAFIAAAVTTVLLAFVSWLAFGTESWQAFFHWLPMFSQAFLTEGRAPWYKLQSIFGWVRYCGGSEFLAWAFQWILTATVAVFLFVLWRSNRVRYTMKAAALATGSLLATPYLFLYDQMVLAIPVALLLRVGISHGFRRYELPALGAAVFLLMFYPLFVAPTGFIATVIVAALVMRRCGVWGTEAVTRPALNAPQLPA